MTPRDRPLRIVLVEDHDSSRRLLGRLLDGLGHDVMPARDVRSALRIITSRPFDLLISDLCLPDGTGLEIMRFARQTRDAKGICISALGSEQDIRLCREAGFCAHLLKPISFETLQHAIREACF